MSNNDNLITRIENSQDLSESTKGFLTTLLSDSLSEKEIEDLLAKFAEAQDAD